MNLIINRLISGTITFQQSAKLSLTILTKMTENDLFEPPSRVRGIKKLDKTLFAKEISVPFIQINAKKLPVFFKHFKKYKLEPKLSGKIAEENGQKYVLLKPEVSMKTFTEDEVTKLKEIGVNEICTTKISLNYDDYGRKNIIKGILPIGEDEVSSGFTQVGHIVHLNLRENLWEYKHIIGEILLDKILNAKTVVNKTNIIDNTYRNFLMEVVAGEKSFVTRVVEDGFKYDLDYSKVFWNSRLQSERNSVCSEIIKSNIVFDVFAGIGPFAIRLAKKGCTVFANDLNPDSYKWMEHNIKLNKIKTNVQTFNLDGREFISKFIKEYIQTNCMGKESVISVIMNLPALAIEFLNAFEGLLIQSNVSKNDVEDLKIEVYCYTFLKGDKDTTTAQAHEELNERLKDNISGIAPLNVEFHNTRRVAPGKDMYRCKFDLPIELLFLKNHDAKILCEPDAKKSKLN